MDKCPEGQSMTRMEKRVVEVDLIDFKREVFRGERIVE